jgi:tartrate/fumarate subfamily iron-sulfur-dependent hydro-lyase beta chain
MATHSLTLPVDEAQVRELAIGDTVYLTGVFQTARDIAHLMIKECLEKGEKPPVELRGGAVFHAGPVARKTDAGWDLVVIGPTTSIRMEPYAAMVGELGVKLIIGKGGMAQDSRENFKKYTQAYLQAAPGCAVQLASRVKGIKDVHWLEKGMPEAMWVLEGDQFGPLVVTMDCQGNSLYAAVKEKALATLEAIYG